MHGQVGRVTRGPEIARIKIFTGRGYDAQNDAGAEPRWLASLGRHTANIGRSA